MTRAPWAPLYAALLVVLAGAAGLLGVRTTLPLVVGVCAAVMVGLGSLVVVQRQGLARSLAGGELALGALMAVMLVPGGATFVMIGSCCVAAACAITAVSADARRPGRGLTVLAACAVVMAVLAARTSSTAPMSSMAGMAAPIDRGVVLLAVVFVGFTGVALRAASQPRADLATRCGRWCSVAMCLGMGAMCLSMA